MVDYVADCDDDTDSIRRANDDSCAEGHDSMTDSPKNKFEIAIYLANLASIAMYLDKTGAEHHPAKELLAAEFITVMDQLGEAVEKDQKNG
jgi:hypothetical protein